MATKYRGQIFTCIQRKLNVVLDSESGPLTHVLHIVGQVAYQAFFGKFWRNRGFQGYDIAAILSSHEARTSGCYHLYFVRCKLDVLPLDSEIQLARLVQRPCCFLRSLSIQSFEYRQYFLHQWAIFGAEHLHLRLQCVCQHIAVITHEVQLLDIQLFKYLPGETKQGLFFISIRNTHKHCAEWLTYFDLRLFAGSTTKTNRAHHKMRLVGQLFVEQFLIHLWPIAQVNAERCMLVDAAHQVLIQLFRRERHEGSEQLDECGQALVQREVCRHLLVVQGSFPEAFAAAAQVPVREVLQELLRDCCWLRRVVLVQAVRDLTDGLLQFRENPAVKFAALRYRQLVVLRVKGIDIGIRHEEPIHVPELIQCPAHQRPFFA